MRAPRIIFKIALLTTAFAFLFILGGCPKHENFPTQIVLVEAPKPSGLAIHPQGIDTNGQYLYSVTWTISDDANVDHYRLYLVLGGPVAPELLHDTTTDETSALKIDFGLPQSAVGLKFGLSTVSTGSVESAMTTAIVPSADSLLVR
ncbi:MAG TPA: hypothetical protein VJS69_14490 [Candidatus Krumholzibacteria bacterium]|nr:hypothetical protein [Candidatus Krumholzibacteria bacterium]